MLLVVQILPAAWCHGVKKILNWQWDFAATECVAQAGRNFKMHST